MNLSNFYEIRRWRFSIIVYLLRKFLSTFVLSFFFFNLSSVFVNRNPFLSEFMSAFSCRICSLDLFRWKSNTWLKSVNFYFQIKNFIWMYFSSLSLFISFLFIWIKFLSIIIEVYWHNIPVVWHLFSAC
jgi:hypothetical protein